MVVRCEDVDFDLKIDELRISGYAVIENLFPVETIDRIRQAFLPMLEHVKSRETGLAKEEWVTCVPALAATSISTATR